MILLRLWDALGLPEQVAADSGAVTRYGVGSTFQPSVAERN